MPWPRPATACPKRAPTSTRSRRPAWSLERSTSLPKLKLEPWQRNQYVLVLTVATTFLGLEFSQSFLPLYVRYLGVTDAGETALWSGLLVGVGPLSAACMGPVWGSLADRFGRKLLVLRALAAISVTSIALALAPNVQAAVVIRLLQGLLAGFTAMMMALAVNTAPRDRIGQSVGLIQAAQLIPLAIGPTIGGFISDRFGLRANFAITGCAVALASLVLLFLFREDRSSRTSEGRPRAAVGPEGIGRFQAVRALFGLPGFAATMALLFIAQSVDRSLSPILPLYLIELATPASQLATVTGMVISAGAVAAATSATVYGRLARPGSTRRVLMLALGGGALCIAPIALATSWPAVLGLRVLVGLAAGGCGALAYTLGARIAPANRAGLALGLLSTCNLMGGAVSPLLAGVLGSVNLHWVFLADSGLYLLALIVAFNLPRAADSGSAPQRPAR